MLVTCNHCGKEYEIDITKIKGDSVKTRCLSCDNVFSVSKPDDDMSFLDDEPVEDLLSDDVDSLDEDTPQAYEETKISGLSIKYKITMIIVLLVLCSLSAVGFIASTKSSDALSTQVETQLNSFTTQKAIQYDNVFKRISDEVLAIADYAENTFARTEIASDIPGVKNLMPWNGNGYGVPGQELEFQDDIRKLQRIALVLKPTVEKNKLLSIGYMGTDRNLMIFSDNESVGVHSKLNGYMPSKRPWYTGAKKAGKLIWTSPYVDANTKQLSITCATPVYGANKRFIGVIGFDVLIETISRDVLNINIGYDDSYAFMIGSKGKILAKPGMKAGVSTWDKAFQTEDLNKTSNASLKAVAAKMTRGLTGIELFKSEQDTDSYIAFAPIKAMKASIGIVASKDEVIRPATDIRNLIIYICLGVLGITIIFGFIIGNNITKPLNKLTSMANLISQGKMDLDFIEDTRKDEIGVLTQSINRLVSSLKIALNR